MDLVQQRRKAAAIMFVLLLLQLYVLLRKVRVLLVRAHERRPTVNQDLQRRNKLCKLYQISNITCYEQLRMRIVPFQRLVARLRGHGLTDSRFLSAEEQVAIFLSTVGHDIHYRRSGHDYIRSSQTVFRYFHNVLEAVLRLYKEVVTPAQPRNSSRDGSTERDWHHHFQDAVGAIDGTHFKANIPLPCQARYRNRSRNMTQNVLVACTFDMKFTYVLAGWEGSAHDGCLLRCAVTRDKQKLTIPYGKYYLADAGFPGTRGFLTPYRGVRYHLRDHAGRRPQTYKELYKYRHSSLRNVVDRTIGLLKKRFAYLRNNTFHDIKTQAKIVLACAAIHNFLRDEDKDDILEFDEGYVPSTVHVDAFDEEDIVISRTAQWDQFREDLAQDMWAAYQ